MFPHQLVTEQENRYRDSDHTKCKRYQFAAPIFSFVFHRMPSC
jgi:hypothetical protein